MDKFTFYSDGEYEYRIERHEDDSAVVYTHRLGRRVWSLTQRPVVPPTIVTRGPRGDDDGSYRTHRGGPVHPPTNRWEPCGRCFLANDAGEPEAADRLLGRDVLAACTEAASAAEAAKWLEWRERWEGE